MSNDTINSNDEIHDQKKAIKNYLDCLLVSSPAPARQKTAIAQQAAERIPKWAESGFSALNFRSAGLQLYIPVSFVRGIKNITGQQFTPGDNGDCVKGIVAMKDKSITVIDTEKLVMTGKGRTIDYQHPDANSYLILIGDGSFGLICDTIGQVKQMAVEDVHWRVNSSRRKWLAGMLQNEVAALIDPRRLALSISMQTALV
ncbi:MAG: chemotaxis protein CheW [Gammaproteobacteria bacterium]|nr:chemotaxis protein CheW [Gammaproteobacteria bacterium]